MSFSKSNIEWSKLFSAITSLVIELSTKMDKAFSNAQDNLDIVVDYKINSDGSWYRRYRSGWLEQGGNIMTGITSARRTVTFVKPFKDTTYFLSDNLHLLGNAGIDHQESTGEFYEKTVSYYNRYFWGNWDTYTWYACGQGVE